MGPKRMGSASAMTMDDSRTSVASRYHSSYQDEVEATIRGTVCGFDLPRLLKTLAMVGVCVSALDSVFDLLGEYLNFPMVPWIQTTEVLAYSGFFYLPHQRGPHLDWVFFMTLITLSTDFAIRLFYRVLSSVDGLLLDDAPLSDWLYRRHNEVFLPPDFYYYGWGGILPHKVLREARTRVASFVMRNCFVVTVGCISLLLFIRAYRNKKRAEEQLPVSLNFE